VTELRTRTKYGYDALYELTSVTQSSTTTESYTYDPVGNRLSSLGVSPYSNNNSNELTSTPSTTYTYDSNGNTSTKVNSSGTTQYFWDFENRMSSVTLPGAGGTVTFKYDPFGRRIYKSSSSATSVFAYDGDNLVEEANSSGTAVARYTHGEYVDEPLAMLRSSTTSYYDADGLGSITSLSSSAGSLAQTYGYDSFGKQTSSSGSLTNPFQYTGRESDSETGLYFYRARYYDQNAGRFLAEDPSGFTDGTNRYVYVGSRPTILMDPMGLLAELYCERIDSLRGGGLFGDLIISLFQAQHCFIRIVSDGKDETFELYGPGEDPKRGTPHINPYNPWRLARPFKIYPPPNMICGEFENRLRQAYKRESGRVPLYDPRGPNSNTFVNQIIQDAGGDADFPIGAYGADKGLRP
jgi:RHS repeat-associated protein